MRILDENGNELQSETACMWRSWTSLIDNNVWMLGVSQWTKKEEV